ncbi:hypothetical protein HAX54_008677 [Datura stramonium]|uniref:Uncharacterized protein n=1 Tax=Datura stramonium TaxID=4076 RepID=A0ABS8TDM2_DATST|nr:hypothetical protein [Datura stramonium]
MAPKAKKGKGAASSSHGNDRSRMGEEAPTKDASMPPQPPREEVSLVSCDVVDEPEEQERLADYKKPFIVIDENEGDEKSLVMAKEMAKEKGKEKEVPKLLTPIQRPPLPFSKILKKKVEDVEVTAKEKFMAKVLAAVIIDELVTCLPQVSTASGRCHAGGVEGLLEMGLCAASRHIRTASSM